MPLKVDPFLGDEMLLWTYIFFLMWQLFFWNIHKPHFLPQRASQDNQTSKPNMKRSSPQTKHDLSFFPFLSFLTITIKWGFLKSFLNFLLLYSWKVHWEKHNCSFVLQSVQILGYCGYSFPGTARLQTFCFLIADALSFIQAPWTIGSPKSSSPPFQRYTITLHKDSMKYSFN